MASLSFSLLRAEVDLRPYEDDGQGAGGERQVWFVGEPAQSNLLSPTYLPASSDDTTDALKRWSPFEMNEDGMNLIHSHVLILQTGRSAAIRYAHTYICTHIHIYLSSAFGH